MGGFRNVTFDSKARFPTALCTNATVGWTKTSAKVSTASNDGLVVGWTVNHDAVDWDSLRSVYGWSTLQYSTWLRGTIYNHRPKPQLISIHFTGVLEFRINNHSYFGGDFYGLHKVPVIVELPAGESTIDVRLTRDVRAMGGTGKSTILADMTLQSELRQVHFLKHTVVSPEIYNGSLSSIYFGVVLQNSLSSGIVVTACDSNIESGDLEIDGKGIVHLISGQARSLTLTVKSTAKLHIVSRNTVKLRLCYTETPSEDNAVHRLALTIPITATKGDGLHRFTFIHPSGVVSYALIRPPDPVTRGQDHTPVLAVLHGAGVDADSEMMRHSFDELKDLPALTIFPTGMNTWSADDWHTWGMADVLASIDALAMWQTDVAWRGPRVDTDQFLISGHSNGGQGTWYLASHHPDRVLAAAPLSGYTSIENYVPYSFWHIAEQNRILDVARLDFRNELFIPNLRGIPVLQQHGGKDDNVPTYHSRLMKTYRANLGFDSSYVEVPNKGHWWDGVLTTEELRDFYSEQLAKRRNPNVGLTHFEYVVSDSANFGSVYGLHVDQLRSHDQLGQLSVTVDKHAKDVWHVETVNIHRFTLNAHKWWANPPRCVHIDEGNECLDVVNVSLLRARNGTWTQARSTWPDLNTRYGRQRGALDAVLNTISALTIVDCTGADMRLALQTSRNMLQYFGADSEILECHERESTVTRRGNVMTFFRGSQVLPSLLSNFPITINDHAVRIVAKDGFVRRIKLTAGMGAIFLRPLPEERLELVVWGYDNNGLSRAARLIPTITGAGQPDFVIVSVRSGWKGSGGALAMGFFDHDWQISGGSYL